MMSRLLGTVSRLVYSNIHLGSVQSRATVKPIYVRNRELVRYPLWNQLSDARAKNMTDYKSESTVGSQPLSLILYYSKGGLIFVLHSEANGDVVPNED